MKCKTRFTKKNILIQNGIYAFILVHVTIAQLLRLEHFRLTRTIMQVNSIFIRKPEAEAWLENQEIVCKFTRFRSKAAECEQKYMQLQECRFLPFICILKQKMSNWYLNSFLDKWK